MRTHCVTLSVRSKATVSPARCFLIVIELMCKEDSTLSWSQHLPLVMLKREMDGLEEAAWWLVMSKIGRKDDKEIG